MRVGEIGHEAAIPTKTIRFWESAGLVPEPTRTSGGYRDYEPATIERLELIRNAQGAGLATRSGGCSRSRIPASRRASTYGL